MSSRSKAIAILLLVAIASGVAGAALAFHVATRRLSRVFEGGGSTHTVARLYGAELERQLRLTQAQREEIERIVESDHDDFSRIARKVYPELSEMRRRRHARIRAVLAPAQGTAFDALMADYEERRRRDLDVQ